jgi:hypothetical protein
VGEEGDEDEADDDEEGCSNSLLVSVAIASPSVDHQAENLTNVSDDHTNASISRRATSRSL